MMYYWNYYQYQNSLLALKINNNDDVIFYLTNTYGIYKYSRNWTQLGVYLNYDNYNNYGKLIYSSKNDHLLVTSGSAPKIDVFDSNLNFIKSINTSTIDYYYNYFFYYGTVDSSTTDIKEYNNQFFVTTRSSFVFVLENEVVISNFSTLCVSINALEIDSNGLLALLCSNKIYVYNSNGQYMNISWASLVPYPVDLGFDADGNFLIISTNGVFLLNTEATIIQSNVTLDSCTLKSNFLI